MLDLERLKRIRLDRVPWGQILVAELGLRWDYLLPRRTRIELQGLDNLPEEPCFIAMNHTDRYNYWPFQYALYRRRRAYTVTWVKGKYFEHPFTAWFMARTNNIPVPSRGYVLVTAFRHTMDRAPEAAEYRALRTLVDGDDATLPADAPAAAIDFVERRGGASRFVEAFDALFSEMMEEVVALNRRAFELGSHVLVFPQGTRSKRLPDGHGGLAQMAWHLGRSIVPVGCNGSDRLYPGSAPISRGGRVVYRIGRPIRLDTPELASLRPTAPYVPFTREAERAHGDAFRATTERVMQRIDELLDPEYQRASGETDGVTDVSRFV